MAKTIKSPKIKPKVRKIPSLNIMVNGNIDIDTLSRIPEFMKTIQNETLYAIQEGLNKNKQSVSLFEINHSGYYIDLERENWKSSLEHILNHFEKDEDYNKCIQCRDLIEKL